MAALKKSVEAKSTQKPRDVVAKNIKKAGSRAKPQPEVRGKPRQRREARS
jgi:hypothetical protein